MLKRYLPFIMAVGIGLSYIISGSSPVISSWKATLDKWFLISTAFAVLIGTASLSQVHWRNLRRPDRRIYSVALGIALYGTILLGLIQTGRGAQYQILYNMTIVPLEAAILSQIAFYITSAAFRVLRMRSFEASLMLVSAAIVMLYNVPIGAAIWPGFPVIGKWLMNIPNTAAMRAITMGAALGGSATAIRIFLGLERSYLGGGDE